MRAVMVAAFVVRCALRCVVEHVLVYMIAMHMVKMSVVKIIDMIAMLDGLMTAICTMRVTVHGMCRTSHFECSLPGPPIPNGRKGSTFY